MFHLVSAKTRDNAGMERAVNRLAFVSLYALVFTIPWSQTVMIDWAGTITRALGFPVIAIALLAAATRRTFRFHTTHLIAVSFVIIAGASYVWTIDEVLTQHRALTYAQLILFMWIIFQFADDEQRVAGLISAYVFGAYVAVGSAIYSYMNGIEMVYQRYTATGTNPNDLAYGLALAIPMAWYLHLRRHRLAVDWLFRIYPLLACFTIVLSGSRGGFAVTAVCLFYVVLTYRELARVERIALPALAICALLVTIPYIPTESFDRIATMGGELQSGGLNGRSEIWDAGTMALSEHWLMGVGAGSFKAAVVPHLGFAIAPHNVYLSILTENGVLGLSLFLALLFSLWLLLAKLPKPERYLWAVLMVSWSIAAFVANWEARKETWLIFGLLVAHGSVGLRSGTCPRHHAPAV